MRNEYWPTKGNVPVMQGSRPWSVGLPENKKDIVREKQYSKGDSPEEIEDCLWCWLPECKNCIPLKRKKAREESPSPSKRAQATRVKKCRLPTTLDRIPKDFAEVVNQKLTNYQLSNHYSVSVSTIKRWKRETGLVKKKSAQEEQSSNQAESKTLLP